MAKSKLKTPALPSIRPEDITLIFPDDKKYAWRRDNDITIDPNDKENPFARYYDERVLLPVPDEAVRNVATVGVIDPVVLFEVDGKILVDAGNQRIKRRRLANALAVEQGLEPGNVPYQLKSSDDPTMLSIVAISTNRFRQDDDYAGNARNARRMMERNNWSKEETAEHFGVSRTAITQWFDFLGMSPDIIKAVKDKKVSPTTVLNWRKMSHEEQEELLASELGLINGTATPSASNAPLKKLTGKKAKEAAAKKTGVSFTTDLSAEKLYAKAFAAVLKLELSERLRLFACFDATGDEMALITADDMAEIETATDEGEIFNEVADLEVEYDDVATVEVEGRPTVKRRKRAAK